MINLKFRGKTIFILFVILVILFELYRAQKRIKLNELNSVKSDYEWDKFIHRKSGKSQSLSQAESQFEESDLMNRVSLNKEESHTKSVSIGYVSSKVNKVSSLNSIGAKTIFSGHCIVHLDLKGAPPKLSYYVELFPLIKSLGSTGIIIEYEDMFPYSRKDLIALNAYSKNDIENILKLAKDNDLEVIPLIQTFGHLEFVLKLQQYEHLREISKYPQVACPTNNETVALLKEMIDDIIAMHPNSRYLHIGCDEVYYLGDCHRCVETMLKERWTKQQLFLSHVTTLASYIKEKYPEVTTLTWDDEFRKISLQELIDSGIGSLVEPVVWKYTPNIVSYLPESMWDKYATVFQNIWIASAFKGATGPDKYVTDIGYHLENHKSWMRLVDIYSDKINFKGIMLTGWQRYDHFAILCELLPLGIPSLATNLIYLRSNETDITHLSDKVAAILKCVPGFLKNDNVGFPCGFPGAEVYEAVHKLNYLSEHIKQIMESSVAKGWFTQYNIETGISNPSHVEEATSELDRFKMELMYIEQDIVRSMSEIYTADTVTEWRDTNIKPLVKTLQNMWDGKEKLLKRHEWPRRPFFYIKN